MAEPIRMAFRPWQGRLFIMALALAASCIFAFLYHFTASFGRTAGRC